MNLFDLIKPEAVKVIANVSSKKRLMQNLADQTDTIYGIESDRALQALLEREGLGSTGVGQGVALPHARIRDLSAVSGVFMLLEKPIDFGAVDRQPVDVVFCLFAPEAAGVEHLKALALVSRTLREPSICAKLRANPDAAKIYTILTELERDRAA